MTVIPNMCIAIAIISKSTGMTAQRFYTLITMSFYNNGYVLYSDFFFSLSVHSYKFHLPLKTKRKEKAKKKIEMKQWNEWVALLTVYDFTLCVGIFSVWCMLLQYGLVCDSKNGPPYKV